MDNHASSNGSNNEMTFLPERIDEGSRNTTIFGYGAKLKRQGISPSEIRQLLKEANSCRCNPPMDDEEMERIIKNVLNLDSGKPLGTGRKQSSCPIKVSEDTTPMEQAALQLESLFSTNDLIVFIAEFSKTKDGKYAPNGKPITRAAFKVIEELRHASTMDEVFPGYNKEAGILFYINPMKIDGRKNEDVTAYRCALIEYDNIPKDKQLEYLLDSGLPILSITDSGNKSIHALVRIDAASASEYKKQVKKLHAALEQKYGSPCDPANKNPARLSRLAGARRGESMQTLLYTEVNPSSKLSDFLDSLAPATERSKAPSCNEVGRMLIAERGACFVEGIPAIRVNGEFEFGQDAVQRAVLDINPDAKAAFRNEVVGYLKLKAPEKDQASPRYIRFANGVLDIETLELLPNDGRHLLLNEVPHRWNPDAYSELVDRTLDSIALGDEAVIANLWEMFGLSLYRGHEVSRMILLQGSGANGKSTLLDMLRHLLGTENCFSLSIHELGEKFQLVPAMGKLALIGDDIASDYVGGKACAAMKKFVTGDVVNDQYKGGATFQFRPYATLIYSCNEIPRFADGSFGFERRVHPIPLAARFTPSSEGYDPRLKQKLCEEVCIEYAIVKAVDALRGCLERLELTPNSLSNEMRGQIVQNNDPVRAFIDDEKSAGHSLIGKTNVEVFTNYVNWCETKGFDQVGKQTFSKKLCLYEGLTTRASNGARTYVPSSPQNA